MVRPRKNVSKRNIALRIETYERLERFLLELMRKRGTTRVTFDEAINALLDEHEGEGEGRLLGARSKSYDSQHRPIGGPIRFHLHVRKGG